MYLILEHLTKTFPARRGEVTAVDVSRLNRPGVRHPQKSGCGKTTARRRFGPHARAHHVGWLVTEQCVTQPLRHGYGVRIFSPYNQPRCIQTPLVSVFPKGAYYLRSSPWVTVSPSRPR